MSLVGRARELSRITSEIARDTPGCRAIVVSGEPGIGKTRLVREVVADARSRDALVLEGRADPLGADVAYAPLVEAFARPLRALGDKQRRTLVEGLPDLGRLFVGIGLMPPTTEPVLEKTRLFEAIVQLAERLADDGPLLLVLDDLHWADRATLEWVQYAVRRIEERRVIVLATCRTDPAETSEGFRTLLQSLRRLDRLVDVGLDRLTPAEVTAIARAILGGEPPTALAAVLERAGGVPLFAEMLVRALVEQARLVRGATGWILSGGPEIELPPAVRDTLASRLARLDADERRVIDCLAVDAAPVAHRVLAAVSEIEPVRLEAALLRLRAAALIVEQSEGEVTIRAGHPLVLEVAYAALSGAIRARLHRAFVDACEGSDEVERLSRHYRGAGLAIDLERAVPVMLAAGDRALALGAAEAAAGHLAGAVAALRGRGGAPLASALERLGDAWQRAGKGAAALAVWREALELLDDSEARARVHRRIGGGEFDRGQFAIARDAYATGSTLLEGRPGRELALLLRSRAQLADRTGDLEELARVVDALAQLAATTALPDVELGAALARARLHFGRGESGAARRVLATALSQAAGNDRMLLEVRESAMIVAAERGELAAVREHAAETLRLALQLGAPTSEIRAYGFTATAQLLAATWDDADRTLRTIASVSRRFEIPRSIARGRGMEGLVAIFRGDLDAAASALGEARQMAAGLVDDRYLDSSVALGETWLASERDDRDALIASAPKLLERLVGPGDLYALRVLARIELLAATDQLTSADTLAAQLVTDEVPPAHLAIRERATAVIAMARGDHKLAREARVRAMTAWEQAGMPYEAARDQLLAAEADHVALAQDALAVFERLGAKRWADRARKRLRELGVRPPPVRRPGPEGGPLSRRELEVARLFGQGLTTAEVATRLVISPHTAATHLQRIYQRLNVSSRAALTKYLIEHGLAGDY